MADVYFDTLSLSDALRQSAATGIGLYNSNDSAAWELAGVLPSRAIAARVMAFETGNASSEAAEKSVLTYVAFSKSEDELALARENARLTKVALILAAAE